MKTKRKDQYKNNGTEKNRPFKLVKFFTFTGLVVMFLGTVVLSYLNTHWAKSMLQKKSEAYALLRIENLNHQIYVRFLAPTFLSQKKIDMSQKVQFERLDEVVRTTLHSFDVVNVNIFYPDKDVVLYSYDSSLTEKENFGGAGYQNAVQGKTTSNLVLEGSFWKMLQGKPVKCQITTYSPLRSNEEAARQLSKQFSMIMQREIKLLPGITFGVVEIVQDVSEDYRNIFELQKLVIISCTLVMGFLFLILYLVVRKGEKILEIRNQERLKLEEQLSQSKHLASLGEMTAGISHEIRNPLGVIKSSAELLKKKAAKVAPQDKIPTIIVEEVNRLDNIITDFLNYARPQTPSFSECRIEDIVKKNLEHLKSQIADKGSTTSLDITPYLPTAKADFDLLYQAFLNILLNALQAMPEGGHISIHVGLSGEDIMVTFQDTGCGIKDEDLEKIWYPFFTTKGYGTGLGLGLVKKLIESHNGTISIENREDEPGAVVTVILPGHEEDLPWTQY